MFACNLKFLLFCVESMALQNIGNNVAHWYCLISDNDAQWVALCMPVNMAMATNGSGLMKTVFYGVSKQKLLKQKFFHLYKQNFDD